MWVGIKQSIQDLSRTKMWGKVEFTLCLTAWAITSIFCPWSFWFSAFRFRPVAVPLALWLSNYTISSLGSPACRWRIMELLSLHTHVIINNKSLCVCYKYIESPIGSAFLEYPIAYMIPLLNIITITKIFILWLFSVCQA